jgi:Domain of Unknown Function (DUF1080)
MPPTLLHALPRLTSLVALLLLAGPARAADDPVIHLFNGKDLSNFYTWLVNDHRADPDKVFTVVGAVDGAPAIRISGQKYGGIVTTQEYESYHLVVEFRWGSVTWPPRLDRARDSGVLVHCQGPDGNTRDDFNGPWMQSIEAQIIEGGVGDFIIVAGHDASARRLTPEMTVAVSRDRTGEFFYDPAGTPTVHRSGQRINWTGRDPDWVGRLGFRGVQDVEGHGSDWTRLEVIVEKDRITNIVNGRVVNVGTSPSLTRGKITIQSEGSEIFVRRVDLYPLAAR